MAEGRGSQAHAEPVPAALVERQAAFEQPQGLGLVPAREADEAGPAQGQGPLARWHAVAVRQDLVHEAGQLLDMAVQPPEPPGRPDQVQRQPGLIAADQPGQRGTEVVAPGFQPAEPGQLPGAAQLGAGRLGQGREVGGVPVVHVPALGAVPQAAGGILSDGVEQAEPGFVLARLHLDHAAVHQRAERVHHRPVDVITADGGDGGQAEGPGEHAEPGEQGLLTGRQQAVAPVQRAAQGPLPFGQVMRSGGQQAHPVIEPGEQRPRRQQPDPGSGQFDGERQAVQPPADVRLDPDQVSTDPRSRRRRTLPFRPARGHGRGESRKLVPAFRHA